MTRETITRFIVAPCEMKAGELAIKRANQLAYTYTQAQSMLFKAQSKGHWDWSIYVIHYTIEIDKTS